METENPKITIKGIVRHRYGEKLDWAFYRGKLHNEKDEVYGDDNPLNDFLQHLPDGTSVTIRIETHGVHKNAKGYAWVNNKPHEYNRIPVDRQPTTPQRFPSIHAK